MLWQKFLLYEAQASYKETGPLLIKLHIDQVPTPSKRGEAGRHLCQHVAGGGHVYDKALARGRPDEWQTFLSNWDGQGRHPLSSSPLRGALSYKPKGSNRLLFNKAATSFWLCTTELPIFSVIFNDVIVCVRTYAERKLCARLLQTFCSPPGELVLSSTVWIQ